MPIPIAAMGALTAGLGSATQLGSGLIGSIMQSRENQIQRNYEQFNYAQQKIDALNFWKMSNQYNSPEQQMQRLKQAKLNPNLVYGNGANAQMDPIKAPSPQISNSTNTVNPLGQLDIGANMSQLYDLKLKDAQANLTNTSSETQKSQQVLNGLQSDLKRLEMVKLRTSNEYDRRTLEKRIDMLQAQFDNQIAQLAGTRSQTRKTETDRQIAIQTNNRAQDLHPTNKLLQLAELANKKASTDSIRATTQNTLTNTEKLKVDKFISEIDAVMKAQGISPNSSGVSRILDRVMAGLSNSKNISETLEKAKQAIRSLGIK